MSLGPHDSMEFEGDFGEQFITQEPWAKKFSLLPREYSPFCRSIIRNGVRQTPKSDRTGGTNCAYPVDADTH